MDQLSLNLYKGNITIQSRVTKSAVLTRLKKVSFEENKSFNKSNVEKIHKLS